MSFNEEGTQLRALTQQSGGVFLRVWSPADGKTLHKKPYPYDPLARQNPQLDSALRLQILSGPEPNSLLVGRQLFDLTAGQVVAELPYQPQRWINPKRLLALGAVEQADNAKELGETADFVPRGKSLIAAAFNRETLVAKAPKPRPSPAPNSSNSTPERPAPTPADRSKITAIHLKPPAEWAVKPGTEMPRPGGPLPQRPDAFAATEAAVLTENLTWIRYDLNTGKTIGEPIALWSTPGQSRPSASGPAEGFRRSRSVLGQPRPSEKVTPHSAALTRDGKMLALIDPADRARVDVWDTSGKRRIGLRPYQDNHVLWLGWSADGKLLTADGGHLSGWDVATGQATFEVVGRFTWFVTAPGAEWVMVTTPARHLFFVDASTGRCLGHIPASPSCPEHTLSPDGKTLLRLGGSLNAQVWDLQTGKRQSGREAPVVPLSLAIPDVPQPVGGRLGGAQQMVAVRQPMLQMFWIGPRKILSHTKRPGEQQPRYYLYDLDAHTHTYAYPATLGRFLNDSLGRAWMGSAGGATRDRAPQATWKAPDVPGAGDFQQSLALSPGSTIRVEIDVGDRRNSQKAAEKVAT